MNRVITIIIIVLVIIVALLGWQCFMARAQLNEAEAGLRQMGDYLKLNEFAGMFIEKVLMAEGEIDFDMRLKLETAVRDLGNENVLNAWQEFIESQTEIEAQDATKKILHTFVLEARQMHK